MDVIKKDVLGVIVKLSFDEVRAIKKSASPVSSEQLEDIRRALERLTNEVDSLDYEMEQKKAQETVLLKNILDDLELI